MSVRRSSRIATKAGSLPGKEADLVFEENPVQYVDLKSRTPGTPYHRSTQSQKRKRGRSAAATDAEPKTISGNNTPAEKVFTQYRQITVPNVPSGQLSFLDHSSVFSPLSTENDSFLLAIDKIENNRKAADGLLHAQPQQRAECGDTDSPDVFGDDDADILDALPKTPETTSHTPRRSQKRTIPPKRLADTESCKPKPMEAKPKINVHCAKDLLEKSVDTKESKSKGSRKRSFTVGDKKKKPNAHGAQGKKKKKTKFKLAFTNRKAIKELANSATNELSIDDLSFMTNEEKLMLSSWGLPTSVLNNYRSKGITSLFPWQLECLANGKVLEGRNLLYSAPTSAGKTLVSEILMIKRVLELGRKAIMILPYVSVAREKVYSLQSIFGDAGIRVEGFMGSVNPPGGFKAVDIAICTIEKANSLVNKLLEENALSDLGTLVVDELHLIGDPERGYLLELLLTKILYMTSVKDYNAENSLNLTEGASWRPKRFHIQVIGMSATLPNLDSLATWLNAELYVTDFRPVPLKGHLKVEDKLYDKELQHVRNAKIEEIPIKIDGDVDDIVYLSLETVLNGFSVLIFCPTKKNVEVNAEKIAGDFSRIGMSTSPQYADVKTKLRSRLDSRRIETVLEQLRQCPGGADVVLSKTVMFGVGWHHAGLTYENRDIVESAFKRGILKVIVATSTLSAGVNLPARRVMISTPMFNGKVLDTMTYHQMCGRAGRNGIDTEGESILICPGPLKAMGMSLFKGEMSAVKSALLGDGTLTSSMKRALLEAIASGIASLTSDVRSYARCTFLSHSLNSGLYKSNELSQSQINNDVTIEECLKYLEDHEFIRVNKYEQEDKPDEYVPTRLGSACLAASFAPDDAIVVHKELAKARKRFVLENELHVIYQVTPIYVSDQLNYLSWQDYLAIWENLDASEKEVAELIGIRESFICRAMIGTVSSKNPSQRSQMLIHKRFYVALALSDLVNEKSLDYVGNKFSLSKGVLQGLQQNAATFAGMVTAFCMRLGWSNLELLLSQFQERLEFGVQRELCDLVKLDCLNGQRARILYDAGLKNLIELASADPAQVEHILHKATPFNSNVHGGKESNILMIGKDVLTQAEAAQKIVQDARNFIQVELGHQGNIQFAFGNNDVPTLVGIKQPDNSNDATKNNAQREQSVSDGREGQEASGMKDNVHGVAGQNSSKLNSNPFKSEKEGPIERLITVSKNKDPDLGELFTQRQQELEKSEAQSLIDPNNPADEDLFEDSFPEVLATDISALYPKKGCSEADGVLTKKFSIEQEVEKFGLSRPRDKTSSDVQTVVVQEEREQNRGNVQRESTDARNNLILQHSTPLVPCNSKRQRFTLNQDGNTSPVCTVSPAKELLREHNGERTKPIFEDLELSNGILAEFDNAFSSSVDCLDCSIDLNGQMPNKKSVDDNLAENKGNENAKSESIRLSESVAAAMEAFANDTNFESEELFTDGNVESAQVNLVPSHAMPENARCDDFDEEDFILTQQSSLVSDELIDKEDNDMFEESSSDTESTSLWAENSAFKQMISEECNEISVHERMVGKTKIKIRVVKSVEVIPSSFFSDNEMIGVGMKLVSHKKPSGLISRQGIGARIVCKNTAIMNNSMHEQVVENRHSLAAYNGVDTVWVLSWENKNGLRVGGSGKHSSKNNGDQLEMLLDKIDKSPCALAIFDCKEKIKNLLRHCGSQILSKLPSGERIWDPRIAQWMWDFDDEDWNVSKRKLIDEYVSEEVKSISDSDVEKEIVEAIFVWKVMTALKEKLLSTGLWNHFITTEMPSVVPLLLMELNGLGLDSSELSKLKRVLQFKSALLELKAFQIAGRQFNLGSPKDIKQILFREIGLKQPKGKTGTGKDVLLKLEHELPTIIVEWRKVTSALQKVVIPFQQERSLETGRVHGHYSHFTVTGRVIMSDPSLQCIPRDFDIQISYDAKELGEIKNNCKIKFGSKLTALFQQLDSSVVDVYILNNISLISMRNAFIPCSNDFIILTADYSQLELRILAHLSRDATLLAALNKGTDVFTEIASQWKNLSKSEITNSMRQEAKSIVYGVIYGMSSKTLSEQMEIEEREATNFITQFMRTYPGISAFIEKAGKRCQEKGYVETMTGRRRYLPLINSRNPQEKAKASRQAVNSQIQGSAADLVKAAMIRIHSFLQATYPKSAIPIEWNKVCKAQRSSLSFQAPATNAPLENFVFFPILNLHDELIFEVRKTHLKEVANAVKREMESCVNLDVKLPVVIKVGESWGTMKVYCDDE